MLAKWFGLSDPMLEGMLRDRLSFRRFVGLGLSDATPDETTFVKFRNRLRESGHASTLFDTTVAHLRDQGLVLHEGTLVDATIIEAPKGRPRKQDNGLSHTKDTSASYTKKHGRTYHGYKAHIAADTRGVITDYVFDTAKAHDSKHIDQLVEGESKSVYADSAYMDKARKARLEDEGVFCGIIERRVRGQDELTIEQIRHNRLCAAIRAIVEHPFAWMKNMGCRSLPGPSPKRLGLRSDGRGIQLQKKFEPGQIGGLARSVSDEAEKRRFFRQQFEEK
jgi:IS5 family transposase